MSGRSLPTTMGVLVVVGLVAGGSLFGCADDPPQRPLPEPEERALWTDADEVLLPPSAARVPRGTVPAAAKYVVRHEDRYRAVVVECRGDCEPRSCGDAFRPGCKPSETCQRVVLAVDLPLASEDDAYAWLDG